MNNIRSQAPINPITSNQESQRVRPTSNTEAAETLETVVDALASKELHHKFDFENWNPPPPWAPGATPRQRGACVEPKKPSNTEEIVLFISFLFSKF